MEEKKEIGKKEIKARVISHIKSGKNYSQTKEMLEKEGIKYDGLKNTFYKWKESIFPSQKRDVALEISGEKRREREKKKTKKTVDWTPQKQKKADESKLAELINRGVFSLIPCPTGELKFEHIQEINLGGSIVATISFYFPDFNLEHPLVVVVVRGIILVIRVKALCYTIKEKIKGIKESIVGTETGIKEEWKGREEAISPHSKKRKERQ